MTVMRGRVAEIHVGLYICSTKLLVRSKIFLKLTLNKISSFINRVI